MKRICFTGLAEFLLQLKVIENINLDNLGGYMITDPYNNCVVAGPRYELDLDDVADWVRE